MESNTRNIPESIKEQMKDLLRESLSLAQAKEPPGDGYMVRLAEREIDGGMLEGGWKLEAHLVEDTRYYEDGAYVVVHAYSESCVTKGSMSESLVYTEASKKIIVENRVKRLEEERDRLDNEIAALKEELNNGKYTI